MIKINLLGNRTAIDHSERYLIFGYIFGVLTMLLALFVVYKNLTLTYDELKIESDTLSHRLNTLKSQTKSAGELEEKKKILKNKLSVIAVLKKNKIGPVRVMDDLNNAVPERVWLRELEESGGLIKLKGRALGNQDVAVFMKTLEASDYFSDVNLVESQRMYYSKATGQVTQTTDLSSLRSGTSSVGSDGRVTKSNRKRDKSDSRGWSVSDDKTKGDIKIQEFILSVNVDYAGKVDKKLEAEELDGEF